MEIHGLAARYIHKQEQCDSMTDVFLDQHATGFGGHKHARKRLQGYWHAVLHQCSQREGTTVHNLYVLRKPLPSFTNLGFSAVQINL